MWKVTLPPFKKLDRKINREKKLEDINVAQNKRVWRVGSTSTNRPSIGFYKVFKTITPSCRFRHEPVCYLYQIRSQHPM